jgi:hypothetical protein
MRRMLGELLVREDRPLELDAAAVRGCGLSRLPSEPSSHVGGDDLLADAVDRRVRDLREELLEVVVEQPRPVERTASGVSLPIEPTASTPSRAIGVIRMRWSSKV